MPNPILLAAVKGFFRLLILGDRPGAPYDPARVGRILIINTTAIGDTLLSTPAIRQLRRRWPQAHLAALASPAAEQVLRHNPNLNEIILHPGRVNLRYLGELPWLWRELRQGFDLAVILHANDPDAVPLAYLSGARHRYGWAESKLAFLLTMPVPTRQPGVHGLAEKIRNLRVLDIDSEDEQMEFVLTDDERAAARSFLAAAQVRQPYICLHPFGNRRSRWWGGAAEWTELGRIVARQFGAQLLLVGSAPEKVVADLPAELASAVNCLSLRASAALLASARAVISTDSGPLHLAQALATPTLGLFGASLPEITGPRQADAMVLRGRVECAPCSVNYCAEQQCMRQLTPEKVAAGLAELLQRPAGGDNRHERPRPQ